jgi:hypothetical protein
MRISICNPRTSSPRADRNPKPVLRHLGVEVSSLEKRYDLFLKAVYSEGQGYKPEGEHILSLQTKGWSPGSYYVRLSSPSGEVKTVKVVKE